MCEFLKGDDLSKKIRKVVKGKDARCAVAFWGLDAVKELFGQKRLEREDVHVVCDLGMGGTNPKTLRALGAPDNPNIRYLDGLHAKVFLSESGAVVGSANASNNGIGFMGGNAQLLEAGAYFASDSDAWRKISNWLADLSDSRSRQVDDEALNTAQLAWNRSRSAGGPRNAEGARSFLDYDPEVDGLVYVLWYHDDGGIQDFSEAAIEVVDPHNNNSTIDMSPHDIDLRQSWVCCFRLNDDGFAHGNTNPYFFFADALIEDGAPEDEGYENLLAQTPRNIRPNPPFNLQDQDLIAAFRSVIDKDAYGSLRGKVENEGDIWLAKDHVGRMHEFWRDVQDEYRRRQGRG